MQGRGKRGGLKVGLPSTWFDKCHAIKPLNFVLNSDSSIEIDQIGAELEEHMLAIVYDFAGAGVFVGTGPAAEVGAALENIHPESAPGECTTSREAGEATTDDRNIAFFAL